MDIKSLLCPKSTFYACPKTSSSPSINQYYQRTWSCASSDIDSPGLSYSTPSLSPASSPKPIVIPLDQHRPSASTSTSLTSTHRQRSGSQTRTPWSQHEDYLLQRGYNEGLSWAMISSTYLPHRSRGCCWGRFKTLQAKVLEKRDWNDTEDQLLAIAIKKHSRIFKQAWKAVSIDMPNRSWRECESRSLKVNSSNIIRKRQQ
ncbi:hypothetical protein BDC45DRAFT_509237 [Circinella umbellata]|nr:hypothetical protein BDC45DRAFT_509237 [Circinella umbellata]